MLDGEDISKGTPSNFANKSWSQHGQSYPRSHKSDSTNSSHSQISSHSPYSFTKASSTVVSTPPHPSVFSTPPLTDNSLVGTPEMGNSTPLRLSNHELRLIFGEIASLKTEIRELGGTIEQLLPCCQLQRRTVSASASRRDHNVRTAAAEASEDDTSDHSGFFSTTESSHQLVLLRNAVHGVKVNEDKLKNIKKPNDPGLYACRLVELVFSRNELKYGSYSGEGTMKDGIKLKKLDENKLSAV